MATSRIFPLNWTTGAGGVVDTDAVIPMAAIQSITMSIRVSDGDFAIGYIQEFNWSMKREAQVIHQIEAYPNGTFEPHTVLSSAQFGMTWYWPGEPIETIPGKVGGIEITLNKYALYSANLLRSTLVANAAGTEHDTPITNNSEIHYTGTNQNEYVSLIQQVRPITIKQIFISPNSGDVIFGRVFEECWFTDIGEEIPTAENNGPILERGKLLATRLRPILLEV